MPTPTSIALARSTRARSSRDRHSYRIEAHAELILSALAATSDVTLAELRDGLKERGVAVAIGTLWRFFKRRRITRKKKSAHAAEQRRSILKRRANWFDAQLDLDPTQARLHRRDLASTNMARLYGRAPRASAARPRPPWPLENDDLRRRPAAQGDRRPAGLRWPDQR